MCICVTYKHAHTYLYLYIHVHAQINTLSLSLTHTHTQNMMFGHELAAFHTFDQAYFSLIGMVLGGGVTYAEIAAVNPVVNTHSKLNYTCWSRGKHSAKSE